MKKELNKTKNVFVKKSKRSLARSTTALTCLVGVLLISAESANAATASGQFSVASSVAASCSISATTMTFAAYLSANTITATSVLTSNCTLGTTYNISFLESPDDTPNYYLTNETTGLSTETNRLNVFYKNAAGATMTNGAATITGTGTGTTANAGTITGTIVSGQTGKTAGTYGKTMTLNIIY